jgi:vacuolar protein sorting-associated protein 13A/C
VFENERFLPLRGWSSGNLLPTDRKRYSGPGGRTTTEFPVVTLEPGELQPWVLLLLDP